MATYTGFQGPWNFKKATQPAGYTQPTQALPFTAPQQPQGPTPVWKYRGAQAPGASTFDYNDPYQINSIADVILSNIPKGMPTENGAIYNPIKAVAGMVPDLIDLTVRGTINPLREGNFSAFKDNFLINLDETMGILGNPTKALLQGYGKQGVLDALGYGGNGRKNFNWNTGNVFQDMALEFVSDPFTWITLGSSAISHAAANGAVEAALASGDVALSATEHSALKQLTSRAIRSYLHGDSASLTDAMAKLTESLANPHTVGLLSNFSKVNVAKLVDLAGSISSEMASDTILKSVRNVSSVSEAVQRGLFKSVLTTSGILPAYRLATLAGTAVHNASKNRVNKVGENFTVPGTQTVDTFRLPELKHEFDDQLVQLNSAATFAGENGVDPSMFKTQMQKEVTSQLSKMDAIIDKNSDNPNVLNQALGTFLGHQSPNILADYRNNLVKNSQLLNGAFDRQITELDSMVNRTKDLKYNAEVKATVSVIDALHRDIDVQNESIRNRLFRNTEQSLTTDLDNAIKNHSIQLDSKGYAMDSDAVNTFLEAHKADTIKKFENTLIPQLAQQIDQKQDVWKQLGIQMPSHSTLTTINSIYKGTIEQAINQTYDLTRNRLLGRTSSMSYSDIAKQFNLTIETVKDMLNHYRKEISATSHTDTSGIHTTMPKVTALQSRALQVIKKGSYISNSTTVAPVAPADFRTLKADTQKLFQNAKDLDHYHDAFSRVFPDFKVPLQEFKANMLSLINMSDAAVAAPEDFIGTTNVQVLYRKAWNRYQATLLQMLQAVQKNNETKLIEPSYARSADDKIALIERMASPPVKHVQTPVSVRKYADLEDQLNSLLQRANKMNPTKLQTSDMVVNAASRIQQVKLEMSYQNELLLASPQTRTLRNFLNDIRLNNSALSHEINENTESDACVLFQSYAHTSHNYKVLLDRVHASNVLDKQTKAAFKSVLQTFRGINIDTYQNYFDYFTNSPENPDNLFNKLTSLINTSHMHGSLTLDSLAKHFHIIPDKLHTAASDVNTLEQLIDKAFPNEFSTPGVTYVIADIETTGLSKYQNSVIEISYKVKGSKSATTLMRNYKTLAEYDTPAPSLLNKFFPGETELDQQKHFIERYSHDNYLSEQDMLKQFNNDLASLGPNVKLVYHNGDSFDLPFQKYRASSDNRYFTTLPSVDTLKLFSDKVGYKELSQIEKNELNAIMQEYVTLQHNVSSYIKLIQLPDRKLLKTLKNYNKDLNVPLIADAIQELGDFYSMIKEQNELLGSTLMDANQFNNGVDYDTVKKYGLAMNETVQKDIMEHLDAYSKRMGYTKEQLMNWTKFMNQFKLLYGMDDNAETLAFGYKNIVDMPLVNDWFHINMSAAQSEDLLTATTKLAQQFQSSMHAIKNPSYIFAYQTDIKESYQRFVQGILQLRDTKFSAPYKLLRRNNLNVVSQFAVLRVVSKNSQFINLDYYKMMPKALQELLVDDAGVLNHSVMTDSEWTYMESQEHIDDTRIFDDVNKLEAVIRDFNHKTIDPLETLARSMDVHQIVSANALIQAQNLKPFSDLLRRYSSILSGLKTHGEKDAFVRHIQKMTDKLAIAQVKQLLSITPDQLRARMLYDAPWISFSIDEQLMDKSFTDVIKNVRVNADLYKQNDIQIVIEKDPATLHTKMYMVLDLNKVQPTYFYDMQAKKWICSVNGQTVGLPLFDTETDLFDQYGESKLNSEITKVQQILIRLSAQRSAGSLGDMLDQDIIIQMYQSLPDSVKKLLPDFETFANQEYWGTTHYNFINIGTLASRKVSQPGYPTTLISLMKTSAAKTAALSSTELSRLEAFFNPAFSFNNGILADPEYATAMMESLRQHPEFTLSVLLADKKYGYRVEQLDPNVPGTLEAAQRMHAVIMPYHIFSKLSVVLNHHETSNRVLKFWNQFLWLYKSGCLLDPGVFFRNEIDSSLKVMVTTQTGIETVMKKAQATGLLQKFDNAYAQILNMSQYDIQKLIDQGVDPQLLDLYHDARSEEAKLVIMDIINRYSLADEDILKMDANKIFTQENLEYYFKYMHPDITREEYDFTSMFLQNASAGMTAEMQKHFLEGNIDKSSQNTVWTTFLKYSNKLMRPNEIIDQTNRFAQFLIETEDGNTSAKAFYDVARTHFDYANKTKAQRITELLLPFYTFKMRNLEFWANCIKDNPWIWSMLTDIMRPVWNFDDTTPKQMAYNKSLQYQILAGNIPMDNGLILKTSPSFMDAFNLAADPVNALKSSLISPLGSVTDQVIRSLPKSTGTDYLTSALSVYNSTGSGMYGPDSNELTKEDILGIAANLPLVGPAIQRYAISGPKNVERSGGNILPGLLPGIFGAMAPDRTFVRDLKSPTNKSGSHYFRRGYSKHGYYPYSKHPRKQYGKRLGKKSYAKRVYANRSYSYRVYADRTYPTRVFAPRVYATQVHNKNTYYPGYYENFYTKMYTKAGVSRFKLRQKLTQPQNLMAKLKDQFYN